MQHAAGSAIDRTLGTIRFNASTVRDLARDPRSTAQATLVVGTVSIAFAISRANGMASVPLAMVLAIAVYAMVAGRFDHGMPTFMAHARDLGRPVAFARRAVDTRSIPAIVISVLVTCFAIALAFRLAVIFLPVLAWVMFAGIAWYAGQQVFGTPSTRVEFLPVLRATGFAMAPAMLALFTVLPLLGPLAAAVAIIWTALLLTFAIKQTMAFGNERAAATCAVSLIGTLIVVGILAVIIA